MEENNNNTALEKVQPDNGSYYEKKYDYYENKAYDTYDYKMCIRDSL